MMELTFEFLNDIIDAIPGLIALILTFNIISSLLFKDNG